MGIELDNLISVLESLTPLAKVIPEPIGGPLEGALEATCGILRYAKEVKSNKEETKELAQDAASWAQTLMMTLDGLEADPAELASLRSQVEGMLRVLTKIQTSMKRQSEQSWSQRTLNKSKDAGEITKLRRELHSAFNEFLTQSQLRLQAGQVHLKKTISHVASAVETSNKKLEVLLSVADRATLNMLNPIGAARWNSRVSPSACLEDTRVDVLNQLLTWIRTPSAGLSVYWLTGLAGTGKSSIAKSFCEQVALLEGSFFLTTFFISRNSEERRDSSRILTTLVHDLATTCHSIGALVAESLTATRDIMERPLKDQIEHLLIKPIKASQAVTTISSLIIVVDALDESLGTHGVEGAVLVLSLASALQSISVKLLVTSRMETVLARMFARLPNHVLKLHEIEQAAVALDVERILVRGFSDILSARPDRIDTRPWPTHAEIDTLVTRTGHLVVYATTVIKYVGDNRYQPQRRLQQVLDLQDVSMSASAFRPVDSLYFSILQSAAQDQHGVFDEHICLKLQHLVGALCLVKRPLSVGALGSLLSIAFSDLLDDVEALSSVLLFSGDGPITETCFVRIFHQSFQDFALSRMTDARFSIDAVAVHSFIAIRCLAILNGTLRQDICDIKNFTIANADINDPVLAVRLQECVPYSDIVKYACAYWLSHLQSAGNLTTALLEELNTFTDNHLLHWIELLSLLDQVPHAIASLSHLLRWFQQNARSNMLIEAPKQSTGRDMLDKVAVLLGDTLRTLQSYDPMLKTHALQTYQSLLVTMPECGLLHVLTSKLEPPCLISPRPLGWSPERVVMRGHNDIVSCVAFSCNSTQIATSSYDQTVRVWDAQSGRAILSLEGHARLVNSVAFSPDGTRIASGSDDKTVRIWDARTGDLISKLEGHSNDVSSVAFSPDGTKIASGSFDRKVRIWDAHTGDFISSLEGHSESVTSVAFSPDGNKIVSSSSDKTVRIWDTNTGDSVSCLEGHSGSVLSVAFSHDGTKIASGSSDMTVRIWALITSDPVLSLEGHNDWVRSVAFSPDGTKIASGSNDKTVRIWDANTGDPVSCLEGHSHWVRSAEFSPDGTKIASGSNDKTVRIWAVDTRDPVSCLEGHSGLVTSVAFSPDGTKVASGSYDKTMRIWDVNTGDPVSCLEGHSHWVTSVAFSPNGIKIASGSRDKTVRIWDANTGDPVSILEGHSDWVFSVAFSLDGTKVASGSSDKTVRIWDANTGNPISCLKGHSGLVNSVAFLPDGTKIASGSGDNTVRIWDANTGNPVSSLEGHSDWVFSVAFSPDGTKIASGSFDKTVRIWDTNTGDLISCLEGHSHWVTSVAFLSDGTRVISTSAGETLIWDIQSDIIHSRNLAGFTAPILGGASASALAESRSDISFAWNLSSGWISVFSAQGGPIPIFWLPEDRRGQAFATHDTTVVVGGNRGPITILDLSVIVRSLL